MKIHKNIGNIDFIIRTIILIVFIFLALKISQWFYILVIWEIFVLINRWCVVYDLFGINTSSK